MSGDENQSRGICGPGPADGLEDLWEELKFCFLVEHLGDVLDWRSSGVDGPGGVLHVGQGGAPCAQST